MKVLLVKDIKALGKAGDVREVSDGHARNFLIPKHLALPATAEVLARVQKEEHEHQIKTLKQQQVFEQLRLKLANKVFTIKGKADKQHLFAAIHEKEILAILNLSDAKVILEKSIKTLGLHEIKIQFGQNLQALVKLNIERQE